MPKTPRIPLGLKGLNTDIPSHALPLEFFSGGNNMRSFNNALQGVNSFTAVPTTGGANVFKVNFAVSGESSAPVGIYDAVQFTPAGSNFYNVIGLVEHADGSFKIKAFTEDSSASTNPTQVIVKDFTVTCNGITTVVADALLIQANSNASATIRYDVTKGDKIRLYNVTGTFTTDVNDKLEIRYPPLSTSSSNADLFVVDNNNVNTTTRLYLTAIVDNASTGTTLNYDANFNSDMFVFNECLILNTATHKPLFLSSQGAQFGVVDSWPANVTIPTATGDQIEFLATPKIAQYGGRLVALGLFGIVASNNNKGIYNERASVIFSSPITTIADLTGVEWAVASTNSTVDDIITESPGPVIDGGILGDNFIVYKSDCVISYREVTSSPYIIGRVIQTDDGMISSKCFADIGNNQHIVFGNHNIYIHNGENQKQLVSKNKIEESLYPEIHTEKRGQCFVFRHEQDRETWFCIPTTTHTGKGCNKAYCYAEETDSWYTRDLDNYTNIFTTEIGGIVRILATKPTSPQLQELDTNFVAGGTIEFSNNPLETSAITKTITAAYPITGNSVKVGLTSTDSIGDTSSITTKAFNPANDYKVNFRETGRFFDMKIEMTTVDPSQSFHATNNPVANPEITGMEFEVKPKGAR